jgi:transcription antitermination factor NusG
LEPAATTEAPAAVEAESRPSRPAPAVEEARPGKPAEVREAARPVERAARPSPGPARPATAPRPSPARPEAHAAAPETDEQGLAPGKLVRFRQGPLCGRVGTLFELDPRGEARVMLGLFTTRVPVEHLVEVRRREQGARQP